MLKLTVNPRSVAAITAALRKIREMIMTGAVAKDSPIHILLEAGTYTETVRYNLPNPLIMESTPGTKVTDCVIQVDNCESFNHGAENRGVFVIGPSATNVKLRNFTILNTHAKTLTEGSCAADSAEAFVWNNTDGTLLAEGMQFTGRQNVLTLKGNTWFKDCQITGDVDVISGEVSAAFFEECLVSLREDNRGDYDGFAVKSQALANKPGFIFLNCRFTGDKRRRSNLYVCRTEGKGSARSDKGWDNIALLNCMISDMYNDELVWDDDMSLEVYPRGNAKSGVREYNTKTVAKNGDVLEAETVTRNIKSYLLTKDDYFANYASRYLILKDTPFAEKAE